jgi:hypothetical protein
MKIPPLDTQHISAINLVSAICSISTLIRKLELLPETSVTGLEPEPAIVPDRNDQNRPIIPDLGPSPRLPLVRKTIRHALTAEWRTSHFCIFRPVLTKDADYAGGVGPVPWTEVEKSEVKGEKIWFNDAGLPDRKEAPFKEPGKLRLEQGLVWLVHLSKHQNGAPEEECVQWRQVYGSTKPPPPWSTAVQPVTQVPRGQRMVHLLTYDTFLKISQAAVAIPYPNETWVWLAHLNGENNPSSRWMGLPLKLATEVEPLIDEVELEVMKGMFGAGYEEVAGVVEGLVTLVNDAEKLGPSEVSSTLPSHMVFFVPPPE